MTHKIKYYLLLLLMILSVDISAQDFKVDFVKLNNFYSKVGNFSADLSIKMYLTQTCKDPFSIESASIKKKGENYFYTMDNTTMLSNERFGIMIDDEDKTIIISKNEGANKLKSSVDFDVDKLVDSSDSIVFKGLSGNLLKYCIFSYKQIIQETYLEFTTEGVLQSIIYKYNPAFNVETGKVVIDYKNINLSPNFSDDEFSETKYFNIIGNMVTPIGKYITYEVSKFE